jgi:CheY-like chemotaxis protein
MAEKSTTLQLILIDDNDIDQLLHRKLIERTQLDVVMHQFTDATKALEAIANREIPTDAYERNIILLDIKMPVMDGFQFLEAFHLLSDEIKNAYTIFILTSSLNQFDISRSKSNPYVKDMVTKPINYETLLNLLSQH